MRNIPYKALKSSPIGQALFKVVQSRKAATRLLEFIYLLNGESLEETEKANFDTFDISCAVYFNDIPLRDSLLWEISTEMFHVRKCDNYPVDVITLPKL